MEKGMKKKIIAYVVLGLLSIAGVLFIIVTEPIPQNMLYHNFADKSSLLSLNNFMDVISNVGFLLVGLTGIYYLLRHEKYKIIFITNTEIKAYYFFFVGLVLTAIGSAYYHLNPNNFTLLWDRLPMTVAFMGFFTAVINEKVHVRLGAKLLLPLIFLGMLSVMYWYMTELSSNGDLRFYILVQYLPIVMIPFLILLLPSKYSKSFYFVIVVLIYAAAKVFEVLDAAIYKLGIGISGHTIKHLVAAYACYWVVLMLKRRKVM